MPKFTHIDISADQPERAAEFYRRAFGWVVTKLDGPVPYWLVDVNTGSPTDMGAGIGQRSDADRSVVPMIDVSSADASAAAIVAAGGTIEIPKTAIPGVGQIVTFRDTEGNVLAVLEPEPPPPPP